MPESQAAYLLAVRLLGDGPGGAEVADADDVAVVEARAEAVVEEHGNRLEGVLDHRCEAALHGVADAAAAEGMPRPRALLACAQALDAAMHTRFTEQWLGAHGGGEFELRPGEWFPAADHRPLLDTEPTSRPASLGVRAGETDHLRRHDGLVAVTVDASRADAVDALCEDLRSVATVYPGPDGPSGLAGLASAAFAGGATVVLLPELHSPDDAEIDDVLRRLPADSLFVPGSRSEPQDGATVNRLRMWFGADAFGAGLPGAAVHDKFAPFVGASSREQISPRAPHLRVHVGHRDRVVGLVCKDLLSLDVVQTLCRLGVTLVVCPAWSAKTDGFAAAATLLANHAQGVTVVANGPPVGDTDDDVSAVYGRPVRGSVLVRTARRAGPVADLRDLSEP